MLVAVVGTGPVTSSMTGRSFVDTNVFVYAADVSPSEQSKHDIASALLADGSNSRVISTQVLQEFYVVITRKLRRPMSQEAAAAAVHQMARLEVVQLDVPLIVAAIETSRAMGLSLWDALIVEAARYARCPRILTEDLSHGQEIHGVHIENPFLAAAG